jgi:hypothetical protein
MRTRRPVPLGPVFVPIITVRSGNAVMNDCATCVIALRPTAAGSSLTRSDPSEANHLLHTEPGLLTSHGELANRPF